MATRSSLLNNVLGLMAGLGTLRHRRMFGGVYIYCDNLFIATLHDETLYFKANAATAPDFISRGLQVFSYPKEGGIATLQYYQAPLEVFQGAATMRLWAEKALFAARQDAAVKARKTGTQTKTNAARKRKASDSP